MFLPPTLQISLSGIGRAGTEDKFEDTLKMQHVGNHKLQLKGAHSMTPLRCNMCASTSCYPVMYMAWHTSVWPGGPSTAQPSIGLWRKLACRTPQRGSASGGLTTSEIDLMTGYKCNGPSQPAIHYNIISESWYISVSYFKRRDLAKRPLVGASCFKTQVLLHPRPCLSSTCSADYASSPVGAS